MTGNQWNQMKTSWDLNHLSHMAPNKQLISSLCKLVIISFFFFLMITTLIKQTCPMLVLQTYPWWDSRVNSFNAVGTRPVQKLPFVILICFLVCSNTTMNGTHMIVEKHENSVPWKWWTLMGLRFFTFNLTKVNFHVIFIFLISSWCVIISVKGLKQLKINYYL